MAQYTYTGYDASAHVAEETQNASRRGAQGHRAVASWSRSSPASAALRRHLRRSRTTTSRAAPARPVPAGADLHRRGRTPHRRVPAVHLRGRAVLLRHGVGDGELPHGVSPSAATARCPARGCGPRSTPAPARPTNSIWLCVVLLDRPGAAGAEQHRGLLRRHRDRRHRPLHRVRRPGLPAPARQGLPGRPLEPRPVEQADRLDRRGLGRRSSASCSSCRPTYPITGRTSTTRSSPSPSCSAGPGCGGQRGVPGSPVRARTSMASAVPGAGARDTRSGRRDLADVTRGISGARCPTAGARGLRGSAVRTAVAARPRRQRVRVDGRAAGAGDPARRVRPGRPAAARARARRAARRQPGDAARGDRGAARRGTWSRPGAAAAGAPSWSTSRRRPAAAPPAPVAREMRRPLLDALDFRRVVEPGAAQLAAARTLTADQRA